MKGVPQENEYINYFDTGLRVHEYSKLWSDSIFALRGYSVSIFELKLPYIECD